ncbi:hypothetical protein ElyMa_001488100 [Elysia marginata]|uniref:Uncharacterized protein n=1 Tax=Elysia marginata TaxID=1093978 RepID=A0AAV4J518_9GAST|nr:hypothetical protein ElyMa_001488100 [Elysia marginata]
MDRAVCIATIWLCVVAYCLGLDFTLKQKSKSNDKSQIACGILTCLEDTNVSVSLTSHKDQTSSSVLLNSIASMSVFKKESITSDKFLLGSVTSQSPNLAVVANGGKLDGQLEAGRAQFQIELVKQTDCEADFVCQVRGLDQEGREAVVSASLLQRTGKKENQMPNKNLMADSSLQLLASIQQLVTLAVNGLGKKIDDKIQSVESKVDSLENKIDDKIQSVESKVDSLESNMVSIRRKHIILPICYSI